MRGCSCNTSTITTKFEELPVNDFAEYMELIVEPTFEDFQRNGGSVRHAYLACLAIYHAVDRAAFPNEPSPLAQAGDPPALPGRQPKFDIYGGRPWMNSVP